jgi:O-antigen/teichoic acid export membrane protein
MQLLNAIFGVVLARKLSQDDYGLIGMLMIFTLVANSLQDSGFVTALTNKRDATHKDFNAVFWFNISVSFTLYILFFFCAPLIAQFYHEPLLTDLSRYYFFSFFIASFSIVPRAILFRQIKQKELAMMSLLSLLISGTVGIVMVYHQMAYWGLATQTMVFNLSISLISWWLSGWKPSFQISFSPIREMFGFSSKMLITNIFNQVNNNIFALLLGKLYTKTVVGDYSQANKWNLMGASTITGMVQGVAQPTFVQVGDDKERLCQTFSKMLRFTCFVSFPAMFGLSLVAPEFIVILIKEKWLTSAYLMQILCIGGAFLPIATLYFNMIISRGKSNIYMWNIITQGCTLLITILCVKALGGNVREMVISWVCITILWIAIWHYFVWKEISFSPLQALRDIMPFLLIAAFTMGLTYLLTQGIQSLPLLLISRLLIASTIYLSILLLLGAHILKECLGYIFKKRMQ